MQLEMAGNKTGKTHALQQSYRPLPEDFSAGKVRYRQLPHPVLGMKCFLRAFNFKASCPIFSRAPLLILQKTYWDLWVESSTYGKKATVAFQCLCSQSYGSGRHSPKLNILWPAKEDVCKYHVPRMFDGVVKCHDVLVQGLDILPHLFNDLKQ